MAAIAQQLLGHFPGIAALLPVAGSLLLLSQPTQGWVGKLLSCKTLVWIGALSYSLYLWHWPVLAFLRYYTGAEKLGWQFSLVFIGLTLALSIISYYWVETPLRQKRSTIRLSGYTCFLVLIALVAGVGTKLNAYFTSELLPIEFQRYADPYTICHGQIVGDCLKGDLTSDKEILILGDSHAAMLNHFFDSLGKELGFKARIITASSCVTIPEFDFKRIPEYAQKVCLNQIKEAEKHLPKAKAIFLGGFWSWQLASSDFQVALDEFLETQSQLQTKVYILEQVPLFDSNPLRLLRFNGLGMESKMAINPVYHQANVFLQHLSAKYSNVASLNFESTGFFERAPFLNGKLIYLDKHHINEVGARSYAKYALPYFQKLLSE